LYNAKMVNKATVKLCKVQKADGVF
jgi:hypothetical protein